MFVCVTRYLDDLGVDDPVLPAHREYLDQLYEAERLIASGPQEPRVGGVLVLRTRDEAEARALMDGDPLVSTGRVAYDLIAFRATKAMSDEIVE